MTNLVGALAPRDGDHGLLRRQGVPAGRGRRRAVPAELTATSPSPEVGHGPRRAVAGRPDRGAGRPGRGRARRRGRRRRGRGCGGGARRRDPWAAGRAGRGARLGQRHVEPVQQADPRRPAVPRDARLRPGARGAARAGPAAAASRAAPGPAGAVPLPPDPPGVGAAVRRCRPGAVRRDGLAGAGRPGPAAAPAPHPPGRAAHRARPAPRLDGRRRPVLRRAGRRRPAHGHAGAHGRGVRRAGRQPHAGRGVPAPGRARDRRPRAGPGERCAAGGPGQAGAQRDRRVDRRHAGHGRRARAVPRAGQQGHPPGRAARPRAELQRDHPADRRPRCCS